MKIAIVGGGIGGLTAAALLHEQNHEIHVFEQQDEIKEIGAGTVSYTHLTLPTNREV